jgi:thiol-disulfide isomerase/thioredoxin
VKTALTHLRVSITILLLTIPASQAPSQSSPTFTIVSLREDLCPQKIKIIEDTKVTLILNGQEIGQTELPKNKELPLKKIEKEFLILDFQPAEVKVHNLKTDLMERAQALYTSPPSKNESKPEETEPPPSPKTPEAPAKPTESSEKPSTEQNESDQTKNSEQTELVFKNKLLKNCKARFVKLDGNKVRSYPIESLANKEYLAIYFSASWCGPCRAFTPKLVEMYNSLSEKQREKFELIFISSDYGQEDMEEYITKYKMPWLAMRREDVDNPKKNPFHHLTPRGIPCLFLLDSRGEVIEGERGQYNATLKKIPSYLK